MWTGSTPRADESARVLDVYATINNARSASLSMVVELMVRFSSLYGMCLVLKIQKKIMVLNGEVMRIIFHSQFSLSILFRRKRNRLKKIK